MTLQDTLNTMRDEFEANAPSEALAVMHRATEDLRKSGIMDQVLKTGDISPSFSLTDQTGTLVNSMDLLEKGPLVIGFYRGIW